MSATPQDAADAGLPLRRALPLVLLGGMLGGAARIGLMEAFTGHDAWTVLAANLVGALALGILFERLAEHRLRRTGTWAFWGPGVLGAFTTFSGLALLAVDPARDGEWPWGLLYLVASIGLGVPLAAIGRWLGARGR